MSKRKVFIAAGIFILAVLIFAIPDFYDTDDTYAKVANQYGDSFTQRGASEICENETDSSLGLRAVPFGVIATACHDEWFVLLNIFPIHTMDAGDSSGR